MVSQMRQVHSLIVSLTGFSICIISGIFCNVVTFEHNVMSTFTPVERILTQHTVKEGMIRVRCVFCLHFCWTSLPAEVTEFVVQSRALAFRYLQ